MAEYIDIKQLWNCETCFHHQNGKCSPSVWCDHGESYRPAYDKLKKADVVEVSKGCKFCEDLDWLYEVVCYHPNDNGGATDIPINYCPNCGARMDGE